MSKDLAPNLPRFDNGTSISDPGLFSRFDTNGDEVTQTDAARDNERAAADADATESSSPLTEDDTGPSDEPREPAIDLEAALSGVFDDIARMRADTADEIVRGVRDIAVNLFPKLADLFLAEELAHHLPALLPADRDEITVSAAPHFATKLLSAIERVGGLPHACTFATDDHLSCGQIRITWKKGGVDYDFDDLLQACIRRLNTAKDTFEDEENDKR